MRKNSLMSPMALRRVASNADAFGKRKYTMNWNQGAKEEEQLMQAAEAA